MRTANEAEKGEIIADLTKNGFDVEDMSDDDTAKTQVRYLMGGRVSNHHERLYSFEFPEQKALFNLNSLEILGKTLEYFIIPLSCPWSRLR